MSIRILFLMHWPLFLSCSPVMSANVLYSSNDAQINNVKFSPQEFLGLQDHTLEKLFDSVGCDGFEGHIWSHMHTTLFDQSPPPSPDLVQKQVKSYAQNYLLNTGANPNTVRTFARYFSEIYQLALEFFADKPVELIQQELAMIELTGENEFGPYEDAKLKEFIKKTNLLFKNLRELTAPLKLECYVTKPESVTMQTPRAPVAVDNSELHPLVYGARKVMATAYQSCQVLNVNLMPLVPNHTPDIKGIVETSWHGIGDGIRRDISSVEDVSATHYYLRRLQKTPPSQGCPNIFQTPLIFDFGGKPYLTSDPYPQVNLFKNYGSGTSALGVDCSGFAVAALAGSGLRIKRNHPIGNNMVGLSSWMLKDPEGSGLNCLQRVHSANRFPLLPGDIISAKGHVVIVERVYTDTVSQLPDPFGLSKVRSAKGCNKFHLGKFQFSIMQSTSEFNGMGINRIHIRDTAHPELTSGLIQYATNACHEKFGISSNIPVRNITISRHTQDVQCMEDEWYLTGQECIRDCSL